MKTRILIDSTVDVLPSDREELEIVPLTIRFGEEEYIDGVTITGQEFYEKLVESDELPRTSQATPVQFEEAFRKIVEAGDQVVAITLSPNLSGTYQSACIAAEEFPGQVYVVDSKNVTIASGILAQYGLQLAKKGMGAREIAEELCRQRDNVRIVALLDTLEYLHKGGRISKTVAIAGSLLSIKPVITIEDGIISVLGKARGSRQGNNMLMQAIQKAGGVNFDMPVLLGYTGLNDALLQKYMYDSREIWQDHCEQLHTTLVGSVVGTHGGPGAIAVAFFAENP